MVCTEPVPPVASLRTEGVFSAGPSFLLPLVSLLWQLAIHASDSEPSADLHGHAKPFHAGSGVQSDSSEAPLFQ